MAEYNSGQAVYCQGDTGSRFYVIKEGSVTCSKATDPARNPAVSVLNAGQYFGERALIKDEIRYVCHSCCCTAMELTTLQTPPIPSSPRSVFVSTLWSVMCACARLVACRCVSDHIPLHGLWVVVANRVCDAPGKLGTLCCKSLLLLLYTYPIILQRLLQSNHSHY